MGTPKSTFLSFENGACSPQPLFKMAVMVMIEKILFCGNELQRVPKYPSRRKVLKNVFF